MHWYNYAYMCMHACMYINVPANNTSMSIYVFITTVEGNEKKNNGWQLFFHKDLHHAVFSCVFTFAVAVLWTLFMHFVSSV